MWQRKQTVFLILAALLMAATWVAPMATYEVAGTSYAFRTTGLVDANGVLVPDADMRMPFQWLATACALVLVVLCFLYRDRSRQIRIARGVFMVILLVIAFVFITDNSIRALLSGRGEVTAHFGMGYFLPLVALVLTYLAVRAMRADEELVRSTERLR